MSDFANLKYDLSEILNEQNLGIISMDIGRLENGGDNWKPLERICDQNVVGLHSEVSKIFKKVYDNLEPINYLFEHFNRTGIDQDIFKKTFEIQYSTYNLSHKKCDADSFKLKKDNGLSVELNTEEINHILNLFKKDQPNDIYLQDNYLARFEQSQMIFSEAVAFLFNKRLGAERLRYVTIVLFAYKYDNTYHFTHSAAIFSDNKDYLDKDITKLIFDNIRSGRYLDEIKSLQGKIKKESIKSAVSAIMSRNMSHNLGSHYLYYTRAHLEEMARKADNFGPDIRGSAKVLGYIQGRMDYLATLISTDKYPYAPVNFKSQLLDDLTIDSFSRRHYADNIDGRTTNFLLANLILSENFSCPDITDDNEQSPFGLLRLQVKYKKDDDSPYQTFTGTNNSLGGILPTMESEKEIKNALAYLNIAMPGGTMSCHAFYNIIENFIRNSAKYRRDDFDKEERYIYDVGKNVTYDNLNITIGIKKHSDGRFVDFIIYDNKANATFFKDGYLNRSKHDCLLIKLNRRLGEIKILNPDNSINKDNKGLKEMLFSAAWMRAYSFGTNKNYADIITYIQSLPDGESKLEAIKRYCFSFVAVRDTDNDIQVLEEDALDERNYREPLNLGLKFTMPVFLNTLKINYSRNSKTVINESLSLFADIAVTDNDNATQQLSNIYTRLYCGKYENDPQVETCIRDLAIFKNVLKGRFPDIEEYRLVFGTNSDKDTATDDHIIKFERHMNSQEGHLKENLKFAYAESVSGGDFTKTLNELFDNGNPERIDYKRNYSYKSPGDEYFGLKIKESALTRITIIDERLFNIVVKRDAENNNEKLYSLELTLKNLRILNYKERKTIDSVLDMFVGNDFKDPKSQTHFLSIHLGIIEKILKSKEFNAYVSTKDESITTLDQKAIFLMDSLKEVFGGHETYITIHSGRGNFSRELEGPLDAYPFISLSSIESAFNNCKYLLSQLFYTTRYVGKGIYNK